MSDTRGAGGGANAPGDGTGDGARFDAVFVGLTILDIAGRPVSEIPPGGDVHFIDEIRMNPAGTAAGAVMNAAKLGARTATACCVGTDEMGDHIVAAYESMGIDVSMVQRSDASRTSATMLTIRPNGDRPALHCRGASDDLFVEEADFDRVCDARFLHHGGTGLLRAMDDGQSERLLAHAKRLGLTVTLDLIAPGEGTMETLRPLLAHVDWFMPSIEEARFLSGREALGDVAAFFLEAGAGGCVFKCGAEGSYLRHGDGELRVPTWRVEVSDTTGCGDAYCGGFVAGLAAGESLEDACRLGSATAALVATGLGSDAGVVDLETTRRFMRETDTLG